MKDMTSDELFIQVIGRINGYLIIMGAFFLIYFLLRTKVDIFLFLLAILNMAFALISYKHVAVSNRLAVELRRAKTTLEDISKETREMHVD